MVHILHIDSSPRHDRSYSRTLAREFSDKLQFHLDATIIYRDLALNLVPYVDNTWINAKFTPPDQYTPELAKAIALSNELIDEFFAADRYVLSVPMYNLSIPAGLKSYIDHIVRPKRTFAVDEQGYKGLVTGKKMLVVTARGSDFRPGTALAPLDFQEPYLRAIFNFIGITDIQFVNANGLNSELREQSLAEARERLQAFAIHW
jgi:FMN-dependent NADH-azoreductase